MRAARAGRKERESILKFSDSVAFENKRVLQRGQNECKNRRFVRELTEDVFISQLRQTGNMWVLVMNEETSWLPNCVQNHCRPSKEDVVLAGFALDFHGQALPSALVATAKCTVRATTQAFVSSQLHVGHTNRTASC